MVSELRRFKGNRGSFKSSGLAHFDRNLLHSQSRMKMNGMSKFMHRNNRRSCQVQMCFGLNFTLRIYIFIIGEVRDCQL